MKLQRETIRDIRRYPLEAVLAIAALSWNTSSAVAQIFVDVTQAAGITHVHCTAAQSSGVAGA
ncbi:MAG: hypothetical protein AB7N71_11765, partial [Phycisphaerae bacterium]